MNEEDLARYLSTWESTFRADAQRDGLDLLQKHLSRLELPQEPEFLLEGTIDFVRAVAAYLSVDTLNVQSFVARQTYSNDVGNGADYTITFDVCGKSFGRLFIPADLDCVDLADLFEFPWPRLGTAGFSEIWISRTDGQELSEDELAAFEVSVTNDLRFDYAEEDLNFWFDSGTISGILRVAVQET